MMGNLRSTLTSLIAGCLVSASALGQGDADLAKQLANPLAALISVPIQVNYNENFGLDDQGSVVRINLQPVIPISISDDWNLISRTILPIVDQQDLPVAGASEFGLGDTVPCCCDLITIFLRCEPSLQCVAEAVWAVLIAKVVFMRATDSR